MAIVVVMVVFFCFVKQKTAYELRISDWSLDVCSSDLPSGSRRRDCPDGRDRSRRPFPGSGWQPCRPRRRSRSRREPAPCSRYRHGCRQAGTAARRARSEEHTSELQSLMRISYAVFCLTKKTVHDLQKNTLTHKTNMSLTLPQTAI